MYRISSRLYDPMHPNNGEQLSIIYEQMMALRMFIRIILEYMILQVSDIRVFLRKVNPLSPLNTLT